MKLPNGLRLTCSGYDYSIFDDYNNNYILYFGNVPYVLTSNIYTSWIEVFNI